jgi:hypothetical protein
MNYCISKKFDVCPPGQDTESHLSCDCATFLREIQPALQAVPVIWRKENGKEVLWLQVFVSTGRMGISDILVLTALISTSALARKYI